MYDIGDDTDLHARRIEDTKPAQLPVVVLLGVVGPFGRVDHGCQYPAPQSLRRRTVGRLLETYEETPSGAVTSGGDSERLFRALDAEDGTGGGGPSWAPLNETGTPLWPS